MAILLATTLMVFIIAPYFSPQITLSMLKIPIKTIVHNYSAIPEITE